MVGPRVLFDTNLYLNFLLSPNSAGTAVGMTLEAASRRSFDLLLPVDVVAELRTVISRRSDLRARISQNSLDALQGWLLQFATSIPAFKEEPPRITRDPKDDYLIALAVLHAADLIVTRDRDLLDLREIAGVHIVDPPTFLEIIWPKADREQ